MSEHLARSLDPADLSAAHVFIAVPANNRRLPFLKIWRTAMRKLIASSLAACAFAVFGLAGAAFAQTTAKDCENMTGAAKEKCMSEARK